MAKVQKVLYDTIEIKIRVPEDRVEDEKYADHMDTVVDRINTLLASNMLPGWEFVVEDF